MGAGSPGKEKMAYQQATLYFHTGTGNSYRVAAWIADAAGETGADDQLRFLTSDRADGPALLAELERKFAEGI